MEKTYLNLDVFQEAMFSWDKPYPGYTLAHQLASEGLLPTLVYLEGGHAGVDQLGHVLWLEVFLGLSGVHDEVAATVVPVNRSSIVAEDWLLIGLLLLLIHQVESVGEVFGFDSISLCLHFFKIIFIGILLIMTSQ